MSLLLHTCSKLRAENPKSCLAALLSTVEPPHNEHHGMKCCGHCVEVAVVGRFEKRINVWAGRFWGQVTLAVISLAVIRGSTVYIADPPKF